jgi:CDP-diacylglycerol--glycerol-3-phosphate 3-phosphatidyltransferase
VIDLELSLGLFAAAAAAALAYTMRVRRAGALHNARVDKAGSSVLLGKGAMEGAYYYLEPVGRAAVALGLTANGVTLISFVIATAGAVALAFGHFGVGGALTVVATLGDALDGIVARQTRTSSDAGEVFDAAVDRYVEFFFLAGLAFYFRASAPALLLALLAALGSFMVSYGTAKAEALQVEAPRGAMRRAERAVYLTVGVVLAPVAAACATRLSLPEWVGVSPILLSLALVGVVSNVSAARRLHAVAKAVSARSAPVAPPAEAPQAAPLSHRIPAPDSAALRAR